MTMDPQPGATEEIEAEFPLSANQMRFWFLDRINPGDASLNVAVRWELRGRLSTASLENAFHTVIDRHEILRTRFVETEDGPVQQVMDRAAFRLDVVDLRTLPAADHAARIEAKKQVDASTRGLRQAEKALLAQTDKVRAAEQALAKAQNEHQAMARTRKRIAPEVLQFAQG